MRIIVTAGEAYTEIDSLASAAAYSELLKLEGKDALVVLLGSWNQSITKEMRSWDLSYEDRFKPGGYLFVIVDVSDPKHIASFVNQAKIIELYDHHSGFEDYWREKLGNKAKIEMIGACATLIWEEYRTRKQGQGISVLGANLLYTAIIANTLNFQASVTNKRDRRAAEELEPHTGLPPDWVRRYYQGIEDYVYENPEKALLQDTTVKHLPNFDTELVITQLELWNSQKFIENYLTVTRKTLARFGNEKWLLTSPSIGEGRNYIYTENETVKKWLRKILTLEFKGNVGITDRPWLRKEIWKKLQEQ